MDYNAPMITGHKPMQISFSPVAHARVSFVLAVVMFLLAAGSYSWNEGVHYHLYLALGLIFVVFGFAPLLMRAIHTKPK
jgi:hypothetical protein